MAGDARERPIIFSASEVRATLDGRKTQTRRIAKITAIMGNRASVGPHEELIELDDGEFSRGVMHYSSTNALSGPYPIGYAVGDRAWVRETWKAHSIFNGVPPRNIVKSRVFYAADERYAPSGAPWRSPIHMPRWASRITLLIENVRVQRLQDISEEDAVAEGCPGRLGPNPDFPDEWDPAPQEEFRGLWNDIHGPDAWDRNPWVVALSFRRIEGNHHG